MARHQAPGGATSQEFPSLRTQASLAHRQPMISSPLLNHPWEKVAPDLFGKFYLLVANYFSRYLVVQTLTTTNQFSQ